MMEEIWKDIIGYEGSHQVSNKGRIKSLKKILSPKKSGPGYLQVALCKNSKKKYPLVHRLIAEAFIPNPLNKPCVNHINGVKTDNRLDNLEWMTRSENQLHAIATGLQPHAIGEQRGKVCKLTWLQVQEIKALLNMRVQSKLIAKRYEVNPVTISDIKRGATWVDTL